MSPELTVLFISMTPFIDMKFGIPLGINLGLSALTAGLFGIIGALIPAIFTLWLLGPISNFLRKHSKFLDNFFEKLFAKTRSKHSEKFNRYGALFLMLFIVAPIPGSGPGAAAIIAFVFGVEFWRGVGLLALGAIGSGILVTGGVTSIVALFNFLFQ